MMLAFPPAAIETMHQTSLSWNLMDTTGKQSVRRTYLKLLFSVSKIYLESLQAPIPISIKFGQYPD